MNPREQSVFTKSGGDARELCQFFEMMNAYLWSRDNIHEMTGYDA
jgi:hypothetical protein